MASTDSDPENNEVSIEKSLLMAPKAGDYGYLVNKHKRAGSTGTTGDESYTTDEEDNTEIDEPDCSIKEHVTSKLFDNHEHNEFGSFSDIATITDKVEHLSVMHRNSSDSSVYSDLGLEKVRDELPRYEEFQFSNLNNTDNLKNEFYKETGDKLTWTKSAAEVKEQTFSKLQKELQDAHLELKLKDEEVTRLSRIRQDVESELEELTASLFQVKSYSRIYLLT